LLPEKILAIAPDYLALDVKTTPVNYREMLQTKLLDVKERLENSIAIATSMNENAEIRITIAPKIIDKEIIEELGPMLLGVKKVFLQPVQTKTKLLDPAMGKMPPIALEEIERYREILLKYVENCEIRGS
jgi:pyruvate-formate lyase-activating enzyme